MSGNSIASVSRSRENMSSVNISSMCIANNIAIAEYNQAKLSKLEAQIASSM